ncbi:choline kinase [Pseudomonas brassicacearum]|uniref:Choline kinase n=1 Tax=Pseudomonas brassicacearum TaxID=930166 RepID=A0AAW8M3V5_9PSED|nr:NTP transferase domain-containing protein [Pseudomonas brassicacearum]MDR6956358.1 choline kinase [Pseudomonas brassicacearum]
MQNVTCAVIAAAGMGTRIGLGMPKCMIEIEGKTILTRLIEMLRDHVSLIHVVVGYREEMVIEYCAQHHRDVVLVRNPNYRSTNTAYSFAKGAAAITGKVVYLDGDLLIAPDSLANFLKIAAETDILVGLTDAKSENAVFAECSEKDELLITSFSRTETSPYEWANIVSGPSNMLTDASGYVFERLADHLPLQGKLLALAEVDTAADLIAARTFVNNMLLASTITVS